MKITRMFPGKVLGGKVQVADARGWERLVQSLEGKDIEIGIAKRRKVRSLSQNAFYWKVVIGMLAEYCGDSPEAIHDACRMKFLADHTGRLPTVRSTASLDTKEFSDYLENCIQLAAEMSIVIPNPFFIGDAG